MQALRNAAIAVTLILANSSVALADTLLIDAVNQDAKVPSPSRGMSMAQVESRFGAPLEKHGAIGQPPISRWDYPGYSVFFEHSTVLHSVVHHAVAEQAN